ncbi:MAG: radical SAM protein [Candidatus Omnitrophota bacterium]|nr:radical SAM protein [Candidatus Omnitrophota bacterium]
MKHPFLIFSDKNGKIMTHPYLRMAASSLDTVKIPRKEELILLPKGSTLFHLPQRRPIGFNPGTGRFQKVDEFNKIPAFAVGAFLIPGYLRVYNPAFFLEKEKALLPFFAYTACGFYGGKFYASAVKVDRRIRQRPSFYNTKLITKGVKFFYGRYSSNQVYKHLSNCALNYNCLAARNLFLRRWEAPLPTAQTCNARCIGCLSYQESDCHASHKRINFKPSVGDIVQVMINHLSYARQAVVSFGQGCEGEPLTEADLIAAAVGEAREKVSRGTINFNTNASLPDKIEMLCRAGVDSFRVSANSVRESLYTAYFRPRGYNFKNVLKSIEIAKKYKKFVSINLFIFPGVSDSKQEIEALTKFLKKTKIDMIQLRNLNIDQQYYIDSIPYKKLKPKGIPFLLGHIQKHFPRIKLGYFNLPKEQFKTFENIDHLPLRRW